MLRLFAWDISGALQTERLRVGVNNTSMKIKGHRIMSLGDSETLKSSSEKVRGSYPLQQAVYCTGGRATRQM